jgi:pimeloyl-ACP methyl ester carboxylesterase
LRRAAVKIAAAVAVLLEIPQAKGGHMISLAQAWEEIERVIPRSQLTEALEQLSDLVPDQDGDDDAEWRAELVKRYSSVTGFLGLLAEIQFGAVDARLPVLATVRGLPELVGRRRVEAGEIDSGSVTGSWRRLVFANPELPAGVAELGGEQAAEAWARLVREHTPEAIDGWVEHCLAVMSATPGAADFLATFGQRTLRTDAVDNHCGAMWDELDLRPHVEKISCPALVIGGDRDPVMPVALTHELADSLGQRLWRLDVVPDCGHLLQRDQPQRLMASIAEFLQAHSDRQPTQTPTGPQCG